MKTDPTDPAMPTTEWGYKGDDVTGWITINGLTKREHFAALAMQGLLANDRSNSFNYKHTAQESVLMADMLIEALNESK